MKTEIELSIVIPTLNEELSIPGTLENLSAQKELQLEVIISDGGSVDNTCSEAMKSRLAVSTITGGKGRAAQLNAGATRVKGEFILFLHADCSFSDDYALRKGIEALRTRRLESDGKPFAGHFCLNFNRSTNKPSLAYSFIESKARIDREGCSHGDQGILISAGHFKQTGGFDESSRILAETRFADRLRRKGEWLLLPAEIITSARRFEHEGLKQRQFLNAVIMALGAAGREDFLTRIPDLYRSDCQGSRADIKGLFARITALTAELSEDEQSEFWENIGIYIGSNAWQLALFLDEIKRSFYVSAGKKIDNRFLAHYERYLEKTVCSRLLAKLAATASRTCSIAFSRLLHRQKR
jgi:rSAM/selenodomain-associated transferase 2